MGPRPEKRPTRKCNGLNNMLVDIEDLVSDPEEHIPDEATQ